MNSKSVKFPAFQPFGELSDERLEALRIDWRNCQWNASQMNYASGVIRASRVIDQIVAEQRRRRSAK